MKAKKIDLAMNLVMVAFDGIHRIGPQAIPASTHSLGVGLSLIRYGYPLEVCIGGFCHDLVEDTEVTLQMIEHHFGKRVAELVEACTFDPALGERAGEKSLNERVFALAHAGDCEPLVIKCADCLDNLQTNYVLKPESQVLSYESACERRDAALRYLPDDQLAKDLCIVVAREKMRLGR